MNKELYEKVEQVKVWSAWDKGVKTYALELIESAEIELTRGNARTELLNGAESWSEYSYGGCSLIYNGDIVERLGTPSDIKRFENGRLDKPMSTEDWIDVQARALSQAYSMISNKL